MKTETSRKPLIVFFSLASNILFARKNQYDKFILEINSDSNRHDLERLE